MFFEVPGLISTMLVGGELVVKAGTHVVFAELFPLVEFHDRASLIIIMSLGPTVMLFLAALPQHTIARVLRRVQLDTWFKGDGAEGVCFLVGLQKVRITKSIIHSNGELSLSENLWQSFSICRLMLIHN